MSINMIAHFQNDLKIMLSASEELKHLINGVIVSKIRDGVDRPFIFIDFKSANNVSTKYRSGYAIEFSVCSVRVDDMHFHTFETSSMVQEIIEAKNFPVNKYYEVVSIKQTTTKLIREEYDAIRLDVVYKAYLRAPLKTNPEPTNLIQQDA